MEELADVPDRTAHRAFLNRYYGWSRGIYDWTRRYYLFGRDETLAELCSEPWDSLIEIGPGTGRNLTVLQRARPEAVFGGIDASDAMLEFASARCPWAVFRQGFAEDADYASVLGRKPDRILFSYCLSMVQDPAAALDHARSQLSERGRLVVVDFADGAGLPGPLRLGLLGWLRRFHVEPVDPGLLAARRAELRFGPGRYWLRASLGACAS